VTPSSKDLGEAPQLVVAEDTEHFDSSDDDFPSRKNRQSIIPAPNFYLNWTRGIPLENTMSELNLHARTSDLELLGQLDELKEEQERWRRTIAILQNENGKLLAELQQNEGKRERMWDLLKERIAKNEVLVDDNVYLERRFEEEQAAKEKAWKLVIEGGKIVRETRREKKACELKIATLESTGLMVPGERAQLARENERLKAQVLQWDLGGGILRERLRGEREANHGVWKAEIDAILNVVRWTRQPTGSRPHRIDDFYAQAPWNALTSIEVLMKKCVETKESIFFGSKNRCRTSSQSRQTGTIQTRTTRTRTL